MHHPPELLLKTWTNYLDSLTSIVLIKVLYKLKNSAASARKAELQNCTKPPDFFISLPHICPTQVVDTMAEEKLSAQEKATRCFFVTVSLCKELAVKGGWAL